MQSNGERFAELDPEGGSSSSSSEGFAGFSGLGRRSKEYTDCYSGGGMLGSLQRTSSTGITCFSGTGVCGKTAANVLGTVSRGLL